MTYPDRENTLALLKDWQDHHTAVERLICGIQISIGLDVDGPLFGTVWRLFDAYTNTLAAGVGDLGGWMEWFHTENAMGAGCKDAGYDGKLKPIKTLEHLYGLIAESRKRAV